MMIHFVNPVLPVDPFVHRVFVEILNIILLADNAAELHKRLLLQDFTFKGGRLSGYFKWSFEDYIYRRRQAQAIHTQELNVENVRHERI